MLNINFLNISEQCLISGIKHLISIFNISGIPEREIYFHIIEPPAQGALNFNPSGELNTLNLETLRKPGIKYTHSGLENTGKCILRNRTIVESNSKLAIKYAFFVLLS